MSPWATHNLPPSVSTHTHTLQPACCCPVAMAVVSDNSLVQSGSVWRGKAPRRTALFHFDRVMTTGLAVAGIQVLKMTSMVLCDLSRLWQHSTIINETTQHVRRHSEKKSDVSSQLMRWIIDLSLVLHQMKSLSALHCRVSLDLKLSLQNVVKMCRDHFDLCSLQWNRLNIL